MIYEEVTSSGFHDAFIRMGRKDQFSYEGREALYEYLEEYSETVNEDVKLDVIALCCEYSEEDVEEVLKNYDLESLDELRDETIVIWEGEGRVLYAIF